MARIEAPALDPPLFGKGDPRTRIIKRLVEAGLERHGELCGHGNFPVFPRGRSERGDSGSALDRRLLLRAAAVHDRLDLRIIGLGQKHQRQE